MSLPDEQRAWAAASSRRRRLLALATAIAASGLAIFAGSFLASPRVSAAAPEAASTGLPFHASPLPVPDLTFEDATGAKRHLANFRGRVVLLNLWATWCAPCRGEMPTLDRLQARLGGKDFEVVALSLDSDGAPVVKRFFHEVGVHSLGVYVDRTMDSQSALAAVGVPTTLLIDREGREVARKLGPAVWDSADIVRVVERQIAAHAKASNHD